MIVPDVNLLLYAYDASSPFHPKASAWLSASLSGAEVVGLYPPVRFAFVRIGTSPQAVSLVRVRPAPAARRFPKVRWYNPVLA